MNLTNHSTNKLMHTFAHWGVPKEYAFTFFNYLVHGYNPGSCFTSILANDFYSAIRKSHPNNTVESYKALAGWIRDTVPSIAHGSYENVTKWTELNSEERRSILEDHNLIFTSKEEVLKILKGEVTTEPFFY